MKHTQRQTLIPKHIHTIQLSHRCSRQNCINPQTKIMIPMLPKWINNNAAKSSWHETALSNTIQKCSVFTSATGRQMGWPLQSKMCTISRICTIKLHSFVMLMLHHEDPRNLLFSPGDLNVHKPHHRKLTPLTAAFDVSRRHPPLKTPAFNQNLLLHFSLT